VPEAWSSGAGAALMASALEALRSYSSATLWVLADNPRARRFYEREGWVLDGGRREEEILGVDVAEVRYRITFD
jgi:GNAT superfamily N-acetyltransferase